MATHKSAKKRIKQNEKRRLHNRFFRGSARRAIDAARIAIEGGNVEEARAATILAVSALDKAAQKSIVHDNNASRRKGRLMKQLAALESKS